MVIRTQNSRRNAKPVAASAVDVLKDSDNRFTETALVRAFEDSFGEIDFDPCWHPGSAVRPKAYLDVRQGHDGLKDEWSGNVVFVNPPWSAQKKWLERAHDLWLRGIVKTVVCLVPAKTDTKFFHRILARDAHVYFIEGRPRFYKEDGTSEPTMVSVMVVMFGATREQKARFAERVQGSWWMPERIPSVRNKQTRRGSLNMAGIYSASSCAALKFSGTVGCGPSGHLS